MTAWEVMIHEMARGWMHLSLDVDSVSPNAVMEVLAMGQSQ